MVLLTQETGIVPTFTKADRYRKARELTGMDQGDFADVARMSRQTVSNYENGSREPRGLYARAWAEATGVSLHWLETGEAPDNAGASEELRARRDSNSQPSDP